MENKPGEEIIDDEINLIDYLIVLAKRKKLIILFTLAVVIITAIYSFTLPPVYKAETTLLPPQESKSNIQSQLLSRLEGITSIAGGLPGDTSIYTGMIKSRTVLDNIIDRFGLMEVYEAEFRQDARKALDHEVNVGSDKKSSLITIAVSNKDPELAADMANAFVDELKNLVQGLAISEASKRRLFFEEKLKHAKEELIRSEEAMKAFQARTGALKMEDQARAVIESIAGLSAQVAAKEVELKVMKTYSTSNNPDLQKVEETLSGLKLELGKLEKSDGSNPNPLMSTGSMPGIGTNYIRKLRDLKFNETLFEIMARQYEMARIDEARDAAVIQVIDKAVIPEKRYKPARRQMVTTAFMVSLFFSVFLAFIMEYIERVFANEESRKRMELFKENLSFKSRK